MHIPKKFLLSDLLQHHVRCDKGLEHGPGISAWMHPPQHRLLGWISRPSKLRLEREVWRLNQIKGINEKEVFVKGGSSLSDQQTLDRFPTLMNSQIFNKHGQKIGLIADLVFEFRTGNILYYLASRSNPLIPGSSRWLLSISKIIDKQPGYISCDFNTFDDLPIQRASIKEEFLNKSKKFKTQFEEFTNLTSNRLEGWIDEQRVEDEIDNDHSSFFSEERKISYDDWIDDLEVDSSQEFNRMEMKKNRRNLSNENELDPWI